MGYLSYMIRFLPMDYYFCLTHFFLGLLSNDDSLVYVGLLWYHGSFV